MKSESIAIMIFLLATVFLSACLSDGGSHQDRTMEDRIQPNISSQAGSDGAGLVGDDLSGNDIANLLMAVSNYCGMLAQIRSGCEGCSTMDDFSQHNTEILEHGVAWEEGDPCEPYFSRENSLDDNFSRMLMDIRSHCATAADTSSGSTRTELFRTMFCNDVEMIGSTR